MSIRTELCTGKQLNPQAEDDCCKSKWHLGFILKKLSKDWGLKNSKARTKEKKIYSGNEAISRRRNNSNLIKRSRTH